MSKLKLFVPVLFLIVTCYLSGNDLRNTELEGCKSKYQQVSASEENLHLDILIYSGQGDWIGQGKTYYLERELKPLFPTKRGAVSNLLSFSVFLDGWDSWDFEFISPYDRPLEIGDYLEVERFPFQSIGQPGMNIDCYCRCCNSLSGSFRIWDITYDMNGAVICLALDFIQYCDYDSDPLTGSIRFNSNISHSSNEEIISYFVSN